MIHESLGKIALSTACCPFSPLLPLRVTLVPSPHYFLSPQQQSSAALFGEGMQFRAGDGPRYYIARLPRLLGTQLLYCSGIFAPDRFLPIMDTPSLKSKGMARC
jgi:hypothetical protein